MSRYRRSPRPLGIALELRRDEWAPPSLLGEVQARWSEAVGATVAASSTPTAERGGVLTVSCAGAVWAQELDLMSSLIVQRLNALLRNGRVSRLRCVCIPPRRAP